MGRHTRTPKTYTLPLVETWATCASWYRRPSRWLWLKQWAARLALASGSNSLSK